MASNSRTRYVFAFKPFSLSGLEGGETDGASAGHGPGLRCDKDVQRQGFCQDRRPGFYRSGVRRVTLAMPRRITLAM